MQVGRRPPDEDLQVAEAFEAVGDRRHVDAELAAIGDEDDITGQPVELFADERVEVGAADLFFAFAEDLDIAGKLSVHLPRGLDALDEGVELALVIGGAAGEEVSIPLRWFKRRTLPLIVGVRWLHIVVSVDQDGRRAGSLQAFTVDDGVPIGFEDFGFQPGLRHQLAHTPGAISDLSCKLRVRADARDLQQLDELLQVQLFTLINIGL